MPGVVTNSRSRPSSLKKPLSRATSTGRSCTAFMVATWGFVLSLTVMMCSPIWTVRLPRSWLPMIPLHPLACQRPSGSAAIPAGSLLNRERIPEPGVGNIVDDHLRHRFEQLELVALFRNPEHDHGLQRRAAGKAAGDLRNGDRRLLLKLETLPRPLLHALDRLATFRSLWPNPASHQPSMRKSTDGT